MKLAKTIVIIVLSVLLVLSLSFNIFILTILEIKDATSFKQVMLCRELINSGLVSDGCDDACTNDCVSNTPPFASNTTPSNAKTIYNENGIKVLFVEQESSLLGPSIKFYLENNTSNTLDIYLTNIYIDGYKAEYCGMYCSNLGAAKKAYESLTLWEACYEDFTYRPSVVEFCIKVQDSESCYTIVETKPMYLCLD